MNTGRLTGPRSVRPTKAVRAVAETRDGLIGAAFFGDL